MNLFIFIIFTFLCLSGLLVSGLVLYEKAGERWRGDRLLSLAVSILFLALFLRSSELFLVKKKCETMKNLLSVQEKLIQQKEE